MINKLDIITAHKDGKSYLKDSYYTRPFRLANVGEHREDPSLYMMIMSSSPGILDNDKYDIDITVEPHSRLQLQTQSYQRLFNMKEGSSQDLEITLHSDSELSYVAHPIVPHENSIFKSHNKVHMSDRSVFTYGEIITCGRKHSGEVFRFTEFQNLTEIFHNGKMILKDNVLIEPHLMDLNSVGQLEGYTHQATLIHINMRDESIEEQAHHIHELMSSKEDIQLGVSQPTPNSIVLRVLGNGGEQLYDAFKQVESYLWKQNNGYLQPTISINHKNSILIS